MRRRQLPQEFSHLEFVPPVLRRSKMPRVWRGIVWA